MVHGNLKASAEILCKAKELGASLAGWASVAELKKSPSFQLAPQMPYRRDEFKDVGHRIDATLKLKHGEVLWRPEAKSVLVIALEHPKDKPEMDWWKGRTDPPGNRSLIKIIKELCSWIDDKYNYHTYHLPYQVGKGGIYLKDAAVLAGIGCVGANNLIITPQYGPRVRLRALTVDTEMVSTGPIAFNPCARCEQPCRPICPQKAMDAGAYSPEDYEGLTNLPGRDGFYNVARCDEQISKDVDDAVEEKLAGMTEPKKILRFCRSCEFSCPVGS